MPAHGGGNFARYGVALVRKERRLVLVGGHHAERGGRPRVPSDCIEKPHLFNSATSIKEQASLGKPVPSFPDSPVKGGPHVNYRRLYGRVARRRKLLVAN
jgi:hypothetical protein